MNIQVLSSCFIDHNEYNWCLSGGKLTGSTWSGGIQLYKDCSIPSILNSSSTKPSSVSYWNSGDYGCINAVSWSPAMADSIICGNLEGDLLAVKIDGISKKDATNGIQRLYKHNDSVQSMDSFKNSPIIVSGNVLGQVALFDLKLTTCVYQWCHTKRIATVEAGKSNDNIFASSSYDGTTYLWDKSIRKYATQLTTKIEPEDALVTSISFSHENEHLIGLGYNSGKIRVYDLRNPDKPKNEVAIQKGCTKVAFSPTKTDLLATTYKDSTIVVLDTTNMQEVYRYDKHNDNVETLAWSNNNDEFIAPCWNGEIVKHNI